MTAAGPSHPDDRQRVRIIIGVLIAMLLAALDQTIVTPAVATMGKSLGGQGYLFWIVSAYFLTATAVTPLYGKLADIHGRRPVLLAGIGIFVAGSVAAALAPDMPWLILARALQGVGGGGLIAMAQTVIGDLVPAKERGRFAVYISGTWAIASIAGPILGGVIAEHLHWSVIFWLNLPLAALAIAMTNRNLKFAPWQKREHSLDILGAILIVGATVALMLGLTLGGAGHGWLAPTVTGPIAVSALLGLVFAWHVRRAAEPLIPLDVLRNSVVLFATLSVFFAMAAFIGLIVYVPLFLELAHGLTPSEAGLALVGYMIGTVAGANAAARSMAHVTHYRRMPVIGLAVSAAALAVLAVFASVIDFWVVEGLLIVIGLGSGAQFPVTTVATQNAVDPRDMGVATGVLGFLRALGSAIGVAVIGAIGSAAGVGNALVMHAGGPAARETIPAASDVAQRFSPVFWAAALSLLLALALLSRMPERPLRGRAEMQAAREADPDDTLTGVGSSHG
ncbi:MAG: MDR family MFS transporter [Hyphomicrobiaceae bacterium]